MAGIDAGVHNRGERPLQRYGPYGQACAVSGAVPIAHGVEQSVLVIEQRIDGIGGAVGLRTIIGRGEVSKTATHLQHYRGHGLAEVQWGTLGHTPQALGELQCGRCLRDLPGFVEYLMAQLARTVLFNL